MGPLTQIPCLSIARRQVCDPHQKKGNKTKEAGAPFLDWKSVQHKKTDNSVSLFLKQVRGALFALPSLDLPDTLLFLKPEAP